MTDADSNLHNKVHHFSEKNNILNNLSTTSRSSSGAAVEKRAAKKQQLALCGTSSSAANKEDTVPEVLQEKQNMQNRCQNDIKEGSQILSIETSGKEPKLPVAFQTDIENRENSHASKVSVPYGKMENCAPPLPQLKRGTNSAYGFGLSFSRANFTGKASSIDARTMQHATVGNDHGLPHPGDPTAPPPSLKFSVSRFQNLISGPLVQTPVSLNEISDYSWSSQRMGEKCVTKSTLPIGASMLSGERFIVESRKRKGGVALQHCEEYKIDSRLIRCASWALHNCRNKSKNKGNIKTENDNGDKHITATTTTNDIDKNCIECQKDNKNSRYYNYDITSLNSAQNQNDSYKNNKDQFTGGERVYDGAPAAPTSVVHHNFFQQGLTSREDRVGSSACIASYQQQSVGRGLYSKQQHPIIDTDGRKQHVNVVPATPPSLSMSKNLFVDVKATDKGCVCKKSQCIKLYCKCFQHGTYCKENLCKCKQCNNTKSHSAPQGARTLAIKQALGRRPDAFEFRPIKKTGEGCACKKNRCLKKYCDCYYIGVQCSSKCQCIRCQNGKALDMRYCYNMQGYFGREIHRYEDPVTVSKTSDIDQKITFHHAISSQTNNYSDYGAREKAAQQCENEETKRISRISTGSELYCSEMHEV